MNELNTYGKTAICEYCQTVHPKEKKCDAQKVYEKYYRSKINVRPEIHTGGVID